MTAGTAYPGASMRKSTRASAYESMWSPSVIPLAATAMIPFVQWALDAGYASWPTGLTFLLALHVSAVIAFPTWPLQASVSLIVLFSVACLNPGYSSVLQWSVLLPLAYLTYHGTPPLRSLALLLPFVSLWVGVSAETTSVTEACNDTLAYVIMAGLVSLFRIRVQALQRRLDELQAKISTAYLDQRMHDRYMAGRLHDAVTAELSSIVITSRTLSSMSDDDEHLNAYTTMEHQSATALDNVHRIIGELLGEQRPRDGHSMPVSLERLLADHDEYLHSLGLRGFGRLRVITADVRPADDPLIRAFVKEIYANIIRHCAPETDEYALTVTFRGGTWSVTQVNTVGTAGYEQLRSGFGLRFFDEQIARRGGTLHTRRTADGWYLDATIPVSHHQ